MRFSIVGADRESGDDVEVVLEAMSQSGAEELAGKRGIMVSAIKEMPDTNGGAISLVDDEPASKPLPPPAAHSHTGNGGHGTAHGSAHGTSHGASHGTAHGTAHGAVHDVAHAPDAPSNGDAAHAPAHSEAHHEKPAHGHITVSAGSPSDTSHTSEGTAPLVEHAEQALEYHILQNQALYLLETAVNKYLRDGWEPQGGISVGVSNNAMQYFQALSRRKKA